MSQAVDHPRLRDRLGFSSVFRRLSRRPSPSTSQGETVCCPSASAASLASTADDKSARLPVVPYTCPSTPSMGVTSETSSPLTRAQDAPREDAMPRIWAEAVAECQHTMGADLLQTGFGSKEAVIAYIERREEAEDALQRNHWHTMRARVVPLARVFEKLCAPIGDTLGSTASTGAMRSRGGVLMRPTTGLPPKQDHLLCGGLDPQRVSLFTHPTEYVLKWYRPASKPTRNSRRSGPRWMRSRCTCGSSRPSPLRSPGTCSVTLP